MICAYLLFINRFSTPDESFAYFAAKRSAIEKGVTQPSQKRYAAALCDSDLSLSPHSYVRYFSQIIQNQIFPKPKVLQINKIMLVSVPGLCKGKTGCNPVLRVYAQTFLPKTLIFSSSPKGQPAKFGTRLLVLANDFYLRGCDVGSLVVPMARWCGRSKPWCRVTFSLRYVVARLKGVLFL